MSSPPDVSLPGWFARRVSRTPRRPALTWGERDWTFEELAEAAREYAAVLRFCGVSPGDRVAVAVGNHPGFLVLLLAATRLGAVFVPLNVRLSAPEMAWIIEDVDPRVICAESGHFYLGSDAASAASHRRLLGLDPDPTGSWEPIDDLVSDLGPAPSGPSQPGWPDLDELAVVMYTSGTTGKPKGAMLTHRNLWSATVNMVQALGMTAADVAVVVAPFFHIGGLVTLTLPTLYQGGRVLLHRVFDAGQVLRDIVDRHATLTSLVPTTLGRVASHPSFPQADLSSLRVVVAGGAEVPVGLVETWSRRGVHVATGFGMTETTGMASLVVPGLVPHRTASAGLAPLTVDVRVVDASSRVECQPGSTGEICVRGPTVMKGYWRNPPATAAAFDEDGYFHSGDLGVVDGRDGCLFFVGRLGDTIVTGGENVYPAEVEALLTQHPGIAEVAVAGVRDDDWGHRVAAFCVLRPGATVDLEGLRAWASGQLARYKLPTRLVVVPSLPRNASGKVLRGQLLAAYGASTDC